MQGHRCLSFRAVSPPSLRHGREHFCTRSSAKELTSFIKGSSHYRRKEGERERLRHRSFDVPVNLMERTASIRDLGRQGMWPHALHLFSEVHSRHGLKPDLLLYGAIMSACGQGEQWKRVLQLLEETQQLGFTSNAVLSSTVIHACGKASAWEQALSYFSSCEQQRHAYVLNTVISACEKGKQWEAALSIFTRMPQLSVRHDVVSFNAIISAYEKGGRWQSALDALTTMRNNSFLPSVITFNAIISACGKNSLWERSLHLLRELTQTQLQPTDISYNCALAACADSHKPDLALALLREMKTVTLQPDSICYAHTMASFGWVQQWQQSLMLLHEAESIGLQTGVPAYTSMINAFQSSGMWPSACHMLELMRMKVHVPNCISYSAVLGALRDAHQWAPSLRLLSEMESEGVEMLHEHLSKAMIACARSRQWTDAVSLFGDFRKRGFSMSDEVWKELLQGSSWEWSYPAIEQLVVEGEQVNPSLYYAVVQSCEREQQWQHALNMLEHMAFTASEFDFRERVLVHAIPDLKSSEQRHDGELNCVGKDEAPFVSPFKETSVGNRAQQHGNKRRSKKEKRKSSDLGLHKVLIQQQPQDAIQDGPRSFHWLPSGDAIVDLHGFPVEVAKIAVQVALEDLILQPQTERRAKPGHGGLIIITGVGKHSVAGVALIKPAVTELLQDYFQIEVLQSPRFPGRLWIPPSAIAQLRGAPDPGIT